MGSNMVDEIDCSSFFDHIDDLIDFPQENENAAGLTSTDCKDFPSIWNDPLQDSDALFSASHRHSASDLSAELLVPYEDIVQLEWLSTFVEDSFSGEGLTLRKESVPLNKEPPLQGKFQTSSPVSVLESSSSSSSSSSCSVEKTFPLISPCQRARTKRPRPATFNPPAAIQLISPTSSFTEAPKPFIIPRVVPESENIAESPMKKKKKIKLTFPLALVVANDDAPAQPVRKCQHCEITKTPQWRAGPTGPKTLCNACGVRYKSGRLFPEYRPAASPTFVPSIHSNSHKKVVEMRSKFVPDNNATTTIVPVSATATKSEVKPIKKESVDEEYK